MTATEGRRATLEPVAVAAGRRLEGAEPDEIITWAVDTFGPQFCITASMADAVLIDLASRVRAGLDVIFLDTGYHFPETIRTRDEVSSRYPVTLRTVEPLQTIAEQDALFGTKLHARDPDACCNLRKVEPLRRSLEPFVAWASGIRRDETESRREIGVVEWDSNRAMVKVNPLAAWTQKDIDEYVTAHDVVVNPLVAQGFPSIGCAPCTRAVGEGEDARAGRWAGAGKTECGLHLDASGRLSRTTPT